MAEMDTPISLNQEYLECTLIHKKNTRVRKDYMNAPRIHSERIHKLHLLDDYDSASKDCNHSSFDNAKPHQSEYEDLLPNALEVLIKIFSNPNVQTPLTIKECLPFLVQSLQEIDTEVKHLLRSTLDTDPKYTKQKQMIQQTQTNMILTLFLKATSISILHYSIL